MNDTPAGECPTCGTEVREIRRHVPAGEGFKGYNSCTDHFHDEPASPADEWDSPTNDERVRSAYDPPEAREDKRVWLIHKWEDENGTNWSQHIDGPNTAAERNGPPIEVVPASRATEAERRAEAAEQRVAEIEEALRNGSGWNTTARGHR